MQKTKKHSCRLIFLFVLFFTTVTVPMNSKMVPFTKQFIKKTVQSDALKKRLIQTATAISFGLAAFPFFQDGYTLLKGYTSEDTKKDIANYPDLPHDVNNYIKNELGEYTPKLCKIYPPNPNFMGIINDQCLLIGENNLEPKTKWLHTNPCLESNVTKSQSKKQSTNINFVLWHEAKHYHNKDSAKIIASLFAIPIGVQGLCFIATKSFKHFCSISYPKTWPSIVLCSSCILASSIPKLFANNAILETHVQYQEKTADKFACQHVKNKCDLQVEIDYFTKHKNWFEQEHIPTYIPSVSEKSWNAAIHQFNNIKQKLEQLSPNENNKRIELEKQKARLLKKLYRLWDPAHPCPDDRVTMIQSYLDNWDLHHANKKDT